MLECNDFIINNISLFETRKELILVLALYKRVGSELFYRCAYRSKKFIEKVYFFAIV